MCNEGQRVSPYSPRQSLVLFMEDSTNYCCQNNVTTFIQVLRFVVNMFYCGTVAFTIFKHTNIKGIRQRLTSIASLHNGYCEATISVVKGHHVTQQLEKRVKRLSLRAHMCLLRGDYWHSRGEIENVMLESWLRLICQGLLSQCTRASANGTRANALRIWFPVCTRPRALGQETPPEPVLIP